MKENGSKPKRIKVVVDAKDGSKIDGFRRSRKCEFDDSDKINKLQSKRMKIRLEKISKDS